MRSTRKLLGQRVCTIHFEDEPVTEEDLKWPCPWCGIDLRGLDRLYDEAVLLHLDQGCEEAPEHD
jgi:hypothetical protein